MQHVEMVKIILIPTQDSRDVSQWLSDWATTPATGAAGAAALPQIYPSLDRSIHRHDSVQLWR